MARLTPFWKEPGLITMAGCASWIKPRKQSQGLVQSHAQDITRKGWRRRSPGRLLQTKVPGPRMAPHFLIPLLTSPPPRVSFQEPAPLTAGTSLCHRKQFWFYFS